MKETLPKGTNHQILTTGPLQYHLAEAVPGHGQMGVMGFGDFLGGVSAI